MLEAGQTNFTTVLSELTNMVCVKRYLGIIIIRLGVEIIVNCFPTFIFLLFMSLNPYLIKLLISSLTI